MIKRNAVMIALNLAEDFASKNQEVMPVGNTVLAELTRLSNNAIMNSIHITSNDEFAWITEGLTGGCINNGAVCQSMHDVYTDNVIHEISRAVTSHISFVKNVAVPAVDAYSKSIQTALADIRNVNPVSLFIIDTVECPAILKDTMLLSQLDHYQGREVIIPNFSIELSAAYSIDQIFEVMISGENSIDSLIRTWFDSKSTAFFINIWNTFFSNTGKTTLIHDLESGNLAFYDRIDVGLALYLIARKLYDRVEPTKRAFSLTAYQEKMAVIRDFGGALIASNFKQLAATEKGTLLVIGIDQNKKRAIVSAPLYRKWLEKNGIPEIILGLIVSDKPYRTADAIDQNREILLSQWSSYVGFSNAVAVNGEFDSFKIILEREFLALLGKLNEQEKAYEEKHPNYKINAINYFKKELKILEKSDMLSIQKTARRIIGKCRFYYTEANTILKNIEEAEILNPTITIREAALIATIYYLADYLSAQMTVRK